MIMAGGEALKTTEFQGVAGTPTPERPHLTVVKSVQVDRSRDDLLTDFGKKTLEDRYLLAVKAIRTCSPAFRPPSRTTPNTPSAFMTI